MACDAKSADGQAGEQRGKRKELLSVSMLYNFLRGGDLGFLSVLRQLQGDERASAARLPAKFGVESIE